MTEDLLDSSITIDADLIIDLYNKSKLVEGDEREVLLTIANVLSDHLGETLD